MIINRWFQSLFLWMLLFGSQTLEAQNPSAISEPVRSPEPDGSVGPVAELNEQSVAILAAHCVRCHGDAKQEGGLRLDQPEYARLGGDSGIGLNPTKGQTSLILERVSTSGEERMPPSGNRLTADQVQTLKEWIGRGAPWPERSAHSASGSSSIPKNLPWAFKPISRVLLPDERNQAWVANEIDNFILDELEKSGIQPSPEADRATLIRRLSLDLLGLPPDDEVVEAFTNDNRPDAYSRLLDRYLASPQFGVRWARRWLDRTNYAETSGCLVKLERTPATQLIEDQEARVWFVIARTLFNLDEVITRE